MNLKNLEYIKKNAPATKEEIENVEKHINGVLPKIYKEFLRQANGMVLDLCVLYDTHRIVESYECNEFADYAPGYISIGNDNGDRELIIKAEKGAVQCGFLDAAELGEGESEEWFDFKLWVENGCEMEQNDDEDDGQNAERSGGGIDGIDLLGGGCGGGQTLVGQHFVGGKGTDKADERRAHDGRELAEDVKEA